MAGQISFSASSRVGAGSLDTSIWAPPPNLTSCSKKLARSRYVSVGIRTPLKAEVSVRCRYSAAVSIR